MATGSAPLPARRKVSRDKKAEFRPMSSVQIRERDALKSNARKLSMPAGAMENVAQRQPEAAPATPEALMSPQLSLSALKKMKESQLVDIANALEIKATMNDLKSDTLASIVKRLGL